MSVSRREVLASGAAVAVGLPGAVLLGQERPPAPLPPVAGAMPAKDPALAACLLLGGKKQIEVSRLAAKRASLDDVKAFAKSEIDEHEHVKDQLGKLGYTPPALAAAAPVVAPGAVPPVAGPRGLTVGKFPLLPGVVDVVMVDMDLTDQCIASLTKELDSKKGAKFDKCYIGQQFVEHLGLLDRAVVFRKHASRDMMPILEEAQGVIEKHIATLRGLMERLDSMKSDA